MKVVVIDTTVSTGGTVTIVPPANPTVKRGERIAWECEGFDIEIFFDPAKNQGLNPPHPFKTDGHIQGNADDFHKRTVRAHTDHHPPSDNSVYKYTITLFRNNLPQATLDPVVIIQGDDK